MFALPVDLRPRYAGQVRALLWLAFVATGCGRVGFDPDTLDAFDPGCLDCFTLTIQMVTWDQAKAQCAARGPTSRLATIANVEQNTAAAALAATIPFTAGQTNTNQRQRMWIGGQSDASGVWGWETGEPFDFMNWRTGEPDVVTEHCLILLGSEAGLWDNRKCDSLLDGFLCEAD